MKIPKKKDGGKSPMIWLLAIILILSPADARRYKPPAKTAAPEAPIAPPECKLGFDVTSPGREGINCRRVARNYYRTVNRHNSLVDSLHRSYFEQLINQDPISTTRLASELSTSLRLIDVNGQTLLSEAEFMGVSPERYREMIYDDGTFRDLDLEQPYIPEILATRIPYLQERALAYNVALIDQAPLFHIDYNSVRVSRSQGRFNNYPTESAPANEMARCTTGGFFNRAQPVSILFNRCGPLGCNILGKPGQQHNECNTPRKVSLSLDGRPVSFSCQPGHVKNENIKRALTGQRMCDPLFYGFVPAQINGQAQSALAACHHPPTDKIGRFGTYTETIAGRVGTEIIHMLPMEEIIGRIKGCESGTCGPSGEPPPIESKCDREARLKIDGLVSVPKELQPMPGSILLSAKLAIENPSLWRRKKQRFQSYCQDMKRNLERENCLTIGRRILLIEEAIKKYNEYLRNNSDNNDDIPMVGYPASESAG